MNWAYFAGAVISATIFIACVVVYDRKFEKELDKRLKVGDNRD